MKILVIDDSLLDRKLLIRTLKKAEINNEILQAENGEEGLEVLAQHYMDMCVILLDWQMPKMSGIEFMEGVTKVPAVASIPIIMVTASSAEENKQQAYRVNPKLAGYIVKPFKPEDLISAVKSYIK